MNGEGAVIRLVHCSGARNEPVTVLPLCLRERTVQLQFYSPQTRGAMHAMSYTASDAGDCSWDALAA